MQKLISCVHNVVLDTIILALFIFSLKIFVQIPISFVWRVYVCLDQISDRLKIQKIKIIITEKFCKK